MTIAAGFVCVDGLVLCADAEMTGHVRHAGQKAWYRDDGDSAVAVVGAGDVVLIRLFRNRLFERIQGRTTLREAESIIQEILQEVFDGHIDKAPDDARYSGYDLGVIVGIRRGTACRLFEHSRTAVADVQAFKSIGSGAPIADYLAETLFDQSATVLSASTLACYVLQQCKKFAPFCGGASSVILMSSTGQTGFATSSRIAWSEETVMKAFSAFAPKVRGQLLEVAAAETLSLNIVGHRPTVKIDPATQLPSEKSRSRKRSRKSPTRGRKVRPPSRA
jgi:hypothetical protein